MSSQTEPAWITVPAISITDPEGETTMLQDKKVVRLDRAVEKPIQQKSSRLPYPTEYPLHALSQPSKAVPSSDLGKQDSELPKMRFAADEFGVSDSPIVPQVSVQKSSAREFRLSLFSTASSSTAMSVSSDESDDSLDLSSGRPGSNSTAEKPSHKHREQSIGSPFKGLTRRISGFTVSSQKTFRRSATNPVHQISSISSRLSGLVQKVIPTMYSIAESALERLERTRSSRERKKAASPARPQTIRETQYIGNGRQWTTIRYTSPLPAHRPLRTDFVLQSVPYFRKRGKIPATKKLDLFHSTGLGISGFRPCMPERYSDLELAFLRAMRSRGHTITGRGWSWEKKWGVVYDEAYSEDRFRRWWNGETPVRAGKNGDVTAAVIAATDNGPLMAEWEIEFTPRSKDIVRYSDWKLEDPPRTKESKKQTYGKLVNLVW